MVRKHAHHAVSSQMHIHTHTCVRTLVGILTSPYATSCSSALKTSRNLPDLMVSVLRWKVSRIRVSHIVSLAFKAMRKAYSVVSRNQLIPMYKPSPIPI
jgi:hypothetical protein